MSKDPWYKRWRRKLNRKERNIMQQDWSNQDWREHFRLAAANIDQLEYVQVAQYIVLLVDIMSGRVMVKVQRYHDDRTCISVPLGFREGEAPAAYKDLLDEAMWHPAPPEEGASDVYTRYSVIQVEVEATDQSLWVTMQDLWEMLGDDLLDDNLLKALGVYCMFQSLQR